MANKITGELSAEDRKMLNSIFLRSFTVFASCAGGSVNAGADGWLYSLQPVLNRYYGNDPEARKQAMSRHTTWYNITQNVGTFAMGLVASMEHENSIRPDFDTESIDAIKVSLMGPMSGIGDAIFWGVLRVIAAGIGINIGMTGSALGAVVFLLIYNIPSILCRYYMTYLGFNLGTSFITQLYDGGLMKLITKATSTVGLVMVGAMTAANVGFSTPLSIPVEDSDPVMVQDYLDAIFIGLVPLAITLVCLKLLKKNVNVNVLLFGLMIIAFLLGFFGIM
jgi:PTS system mannose-specific IID component